MSPGGPGGGEQRPPESAPPGEPPSGSAPPAPRRRGLPFLAPPLAGLSAALAVVLPPLAPWLLPSAAARLARAGRELTSPAAAFPLAAAVLPFATFFGLVGGGVGSALSAATASLMADVLFFASASRAAAIAPSAQTRFAPIDRASSSTFSCNPASCELACASKAVSRAMSSFTTPNCAAWSALTTAI